MHYIIKAFRFDISCIAYNLAALGVAQMIQVIGSLEIDELFTTGS